MPKHEETRASLPGKRSAPAGVPGAWQALAIVALSALAAGYWAQSGVNGPANLPGAAAAAYVSGLAEVAAADMTPALDTLAWSRDELAQFRERDACGRRLAWVTIGRSPGQPNGRIRLQSGAYVSPAFELTDAPVRVALPYPAPYPAGHGMISVFGTTADAIVALTPPWHVAVQNGLHTREVTWSPADDCPGRGRPSAARPGAGP